MEVWRNNPFKIMTSLAPFWRRCLINNRRLSLDNPERRKMLGLRVQPSFALSRPFASISADGVFSVFCSLHEAPMIFRPLLKRGYSSAANTAANGTSESKSDAIVDESVKSDSESNYFTETYTEEQRKIVLDVLNG